MKTHGKGVYKIEEKYIIKPLRVQTAIKGRCE